MNTPRPDQLAIAQEAVQWLTVLEEGNANDQAAFSEWIVRSPLHVQEFLNATAIHRLFEGMDPQRRLDVQGWLQTTPENIVTLRTSNAATTSHIRENRPSRLWFAGLAAAISVAAVSSWWWFTRSGWEDYRTPVGEQRSIELSDGSFVHLSAQSHLQVHVDSGARELRLKQGEALFTVQRDATRPFRVHAQEVTIQALGTQFNVNRRARDVAVAVTEGAVRISAGGGEHDSPVLTAGQQAQIMHRGVVSAPTNIDATRVAAWRERRLVFQSDTLEDMALEFNRYNRSPKIRIDGEEVKLRRFTGVLDANHPESLLSLLAEADDLTLERRGDELVIHARGN